jgi:hypothetical protein
VTKYAPEELVDIDIDVIKQMIEEQVPNAFAKKAKAAPKKAGAKKVAAKKVAAKKPRNNSFSTHRVIGTHRHIGLNSMCLCVAITLCVDRSNTERKRSEPIRF